MKGLFHLQISLNTKIYEIVLLIISKIVVGEHNYFQPFSWGLKCSVTKGVNHNEGGYGRQKKPLAKLSSIGVCEKPQQINTCFKTEMTQKRNSGFHPIRRRALKILFALSAFPAFFALAKIIPQKPIWQIHRK